MRQVKLNQQKQRKRDKRRRERSKHFREAQKYDSIAIEYYHAIFQKLHAEIEGEKFIPIEVRRDFWGQFRPGSYDYEHASGMLKSYFEKLEQELAKKISEKSIRYLLHIYRRLSPQGFHGDKPGIVGEARAILEAVFQKYGKFEKSGDIAISNEVEPEQILNGMLVDTKLPKGYRQFWTKVLSQKPQLVLLKFDKNDLREFYKLEGLAFEIFSTVAKMRIVGKGAPLRVMRSKPYVADDRSDELDRLVTIYDRRNRYAVASATGTVFENFSGNVAKNSFFPIPHYNVSQISSDKFAKLFKIFNIEIAPIGNNVFFTNFVWINLRLKDFYEAHRGFSVGFENKHGFPLNHFIAIIGAILFRVLDLWKNRILNDWQRAYEIISSKNFIVQETRKYLPLSLDKLGLSITEDEINVDAIINFLELTEDKRNDINLATQGPHYMFLPTGDRERFIDYAWIYNLLYNLFYGVDVEDQNFKAPFLEDAVIFGELPLPTIQLEAKDGSCKQIDGSIAINDTLIILECKAIGISFGFYRGDRTAINYRTSIVNEALRQVDEKAEWLSKRPEGDNYDIRKFKKILPIAITPFVEYIPSLEPKYWLKSGLPRVLTPPELKEILENGTLEKVCATCCNQFTIREN